MANKYLTSFNTLAEYEAASLELPNVSLIKSTGEIKYKNIYAGAVFGDILMYDVANQKLVSTIDAEWNTTIYPIADYEPIAINIYPASQTSDRKGRWMSLKWLSNTSATGSATSVELRWGNYGDNLISKDQTLVNGRENTDKALALADGTSDDTEAAFPIFYAANIFHTNGTSAGDWYVPSYKELSLYEANYADINTKITAIKTASSAIVNTVNGYQWTSTGYNESSSEYLTQFGTFGESNRGNRNGCRGVLSL